MYYYDFKIHFSEVKTESLFTYFQSFSKIFIHILPQFSIKLILKNL